MPLAWVGVGRVLWGEPFYEATDFLALMGLEPKGVWEADVDLVLVSLVVSEVVELLGCSHLLQGSVADGVDGLC